VHWQTSLVWPASAPQLQPLTQPAVEVQVVVQTLPVQPFSPLGCPTGMQIPVGQSPFLEHGVPVTPADGCVQWPAWQVRLPLQTLPGQQAADSAPQLGAAEELLPPPPLPELGCAAPLLDPWPELPAVELPLLVPGPLPELDEAGTQLSAMHSSPPAQAIESQHGSSRLPQAVVGEEELLEHAVSASAARPAATVIHRIDVLIGLPPRRPRRGPACHPHWPCSEQVPLQQL
jgi:hypothetical protein